MQIIVCVAVTPSTDTKVKIAADGKSIDPADVKFELNPYDEFAVEEALRLKESRGDGEVEVISIGDGREKEELRKCLARGADRARLLKTQMNAADSSNVAAALASHVAASDSRVVFCGKQTVDGDNGQVPSRLAVALGWPVVTKVSKLTFDGDAFIAEREIEGGIEVVQGSLPCVFSAEKGLNDPRYPSLKGIMAAKKKPLEETEVDLGEPKVVVESLELPPPRPEGRILGEGVEAVPALVDAFKNEAKVI